VGEFSPVGRLFSFEQTLKITDVDQNCWATVFREKSYALVLTNNGFGQHLGDFFANSSGHPDGRTCTLSISQ
jgi:hypothetical protein